MQEVFVGLIKTRECIQFSIMKEVQCMEDKSRANVYDDGRKTTGVNLKNALTHAEVARLEQVDYSVIANLCSVIIRLFATIPFQHVVSSTFLSAAAVVIG